MPCGDFWLKIVFIMVKLLLDKEFFTIKSIWGINLREFRKLGLQKLKPPSSLKSSFPGFDCILTRNCPWPLTSDFVAETLSCGLIFEKFYLKIMRQLGMFHLFVCLLKLLVLFIGLFSLFDQLIIWYGISFSSCTLGHCFSNFCIHKKSSGGSFPPSSPSFSFLSFNSDSMGLG